MRRYCDNHVMDVNNTSDLFQGKIRDVDLGLDSADCHDSSASADSDPDTDVSTHALPPHSFLSQHLIMLQNTRKKVMQMFLKVPSSGI